MNTTSALSEIRGRLIKRVIAGFGTTTIEFEGGWRISIFNDFLYTCGDVATLNSLPDDFGGYLEDPYVEKDRIVLKFENRREIIVDLRDQAYNGPEAAEIVGPAGEMIIIN